jgi:putative transposase
MIAHCFLDQMKEVDVTCSHSGPRFSSDNAFGESQFKTQKYQLDYPGRFDIVTHARDWCEDYFDWYNFKHHYIGMSSFTPEQVYTGRHLKVGMDKQQALDERYVLRTQPRALCKGSADGCDAAAIGRHKLNRPE